MHTLHKELNPLLGSDRARCVFCWAGPRNILSRLGRGRCELRWTWPGLTRNMPDRARLDANYVDLDRVRHKLCRIGPGWMQIMLGRATE